MPSYFSKLLIIIWLFVLIGLISCVTLPGGNENMQNVNDLLPSITPYLVMEERDSTPNPTISMTEAKISYTSTPSQTILLPKATPTVIPSFSLTITTNATITPPESAFLDSIPESLILTTNPCYLIVPDGDYRPYYECGIEIFTSPHLEPVLTLMQANSTYENPIFSPDGQRLVYIEKIPQNSNLQFQVLDRTSWFTHTIKTDLLNSTTVPLSWSSDSQWLAFSQGIWEGGRIVESTTYIINIATGTLHNLGREITALGWSPYNPSQFAYAKATQDSLELYIGYVDNLLDLEQVSTLPTSFQYNENVFFAVNAIAWHPNGLSFAACFWQWGENHIFNAIYNLSSNTWEAEFELSNYGCKDLKWSPNGDWLAFNLEGGVLIYETQLWKQYKSISKGENQILYGMDWVDSNILMYTAYNIYAQHIEGIDIELRAISMDATESSQLLQTINYGDEYQGLFYLPWVKAFSFYPNDNGD